MKKSREAQIMLGAFAHAGFEVTDRMTFAVNSGLKKIRRERYEERQIQKAKLKGKKPTNFYPENGRADRAADQDSA